MPLIVILTATYDVLTVTRNAVFQLDFVEYVWDIRLLKTKSGIVIHGAKLARVDLPTKAMLVV